jgi:hypothetical protein
MLCGLSTKLGDKELAEIGALEEELEEKLGVSLVAVIH